MTTQHPSSLDKIIWRVFRTETNGRAVSTMVVAVLFGCIMSAAFAFEYYQDSPESRPDLLFLVLFLAFPLTQVAAGLSRLIYESQRGLSRLLQLVAVLGIVSFLVLLIATIIY